MKLSNKWVGPMLMQWFSVFNILILGCRRKMNLLLFVAGWESAR